MIKFFPDQRVITMDLVDLEHCGFDHEEYVGELHLGGIDDERAKFPLALLVNVAGGHVITPDTRQETVEASMEAREAFARLCDTLEQVEGLQ